MASVSRSGSSILLVGVTDKGQAIISLAKGFSPNETYRYSFEQFLGEYEWREAVLHARSASFSFNENTRFDRSLKDRGFVPDLANPLAIKPEHTLRIVSIQTFDDMMLLRDAVVEQAGISSQSGDTIVTNVSGTAKRIVSQSELDSAE